jgi:hypothetical protein
MHPRLTGSPSNEKVNPLFGRSIIPSLSPAAINRRNPGYNGRGAMMDYNGGLCGNYLATERAFDFLGFSRLRTDSQTTL